MLFDTHAHYDDPQFDTDRDLLLGNLPQEGVGYVVIPACTVESCHASIALAEKFPHVYSAVGIHPCDVKGLPIDATLETLAKLSQHPKVRAIGEIGLDNHWEQNPELQKDWLHRQMDLAASVDLPVIIHDREAHQDSLQVVRDHPSVKGVFHCYSGSVEMARDLLDLGYMLSFTGVITYKNARKSLDVLDYLPMDSIMIETDSPYLSPTPHRGKRNDSRHLCHIAAALAERKGISLEECAEITTKNALDFYRITPLVQKVL